MARQYNNLAGLIRDLGAAFAAPNGSEGAEHWSRFCDIVADAYDSTYPDSDSDGTAGGEDDVLDADSGARAGTSPPHVVGQLQELDQRAPGMVPLAERQLHIPNVPVGDPGGAGSGSAIGRTTVLTTAKVVQGGKRRG